MISEILSYILKFSLSLGLFWLVYRIFIKKESNIIFNRYYLLITILFSLLIPTIVISIPFSDSKEIIPYPLLTTNNIDELFSTNSTSTLTSDFTKSEAPILEPNTLKLKEINTTNTHTKYWILIIKWIYYVVGSILLFHLIFQIIKTISVILNSQRKRENGFLLFVNHKIKSPYSFLQSIIINPKLYSDEEYQQIIAHENEHCKQMHFIDIVLIEILKPLLWFIPFIWMYEKEIKENHEYLADYAVLNRGFNKQSYQQTLLNGSLGMQYLRIASFLHKSFIKKRIVMMTNHNSKNLPKWKLVLLVPIVLIGLLSFSNKPTNTKAPISKANINKDFSKTLELNKTYQFIERTNGNFLCRGTFTFYGIDDKGIWHGSQSNFTQYSEIVVTAKVSKNLIEIYTAKPWNETWKVTSKENGVFKGEMSGDYKLAQETDITFELKENVNISELMPDYSPVSKELIAKSIPFLKNEKYYWELWDDETQTSTLAGWFNFQDYNSETKTLSGTQYNYRTRSNTKFTGSYADDIVTIKIGEPWNEVWTAKIKNNMYVGEQSYNHNSSNFKGKGIRSWRMSTQPFEDRLKVFAELNKK